jgi:hypothetical protein
MPAYRAPSQNRISSYSNLRQVLAPEYASLPSEQLQAFMESSFGPESADQYEMYLEGIFGDIGKAFLSVASDVGHFAAKAAPVIATVGGGALQGALAGSSLGIPGIIAGAAAGGTGAALSKYGSGTARGIGGALSGLTGLAGQFSPLGRVGTTLGGVVSGLAGGGGKGIAGTAASALGGLLGGGPGGSAVQALGGLLGGGGSGGAAGALGALSRLFGGSSATGQLLSLLQRPETMQALAALNLGQAGRRSIPVGSAQTPMPVSAIAQVIGHLANESVAEIAALSDGSEGELRYMTDEAGEFVGDPALDRDRAARVWELLNNAQAERLVKTVSSYRETAVSNRRSYNAARSAAREEQESDYSEDQESDFYEAMDLPETEDLFENETEDFLEDAEEDLTEDYSELEESELYV